MHTIKRLGKGILIMSGLVFLAGCSLGEERESIIEGNSSYEERSLEKNIETVHLNEKITPSKNMKQYTSVPVMSIDRNAEYKAKIETTEGNMLVLLYTDKVPQTVNNFVFLAKDGFYNEVIFHRVIENFMIQGGDPTGTGSGGPGYSFPDEVFSGKYTRGILAMANSGPDTNGSQFFIMHSDVDLPPNYVIFGEIIEGLEVLDVIATAPARPNMFGENSTPENPVTIKSIQIL